MTRKVTSCFFLVIAVAAIGATTFADTTAWESKRGLYRVSFESSIEPIEINRIHDWVVRVETVEGVAIEGAALTVSGGMPEHDHGLPTRPRVTAELGNGRYRVKGMRFHMAGAWSIEIDIEDGQRRDSVTILLEL